MDHKLDVNHFDETNRETGLILGFLQLPDT